MRIGVFTIVVAISFACASSDDVPPGGPTGPGLKMVTGKEAPSTLIAADGTICNVMPWRFGGTDVGDRVWCNWRRRSEGPRSGGAVGYGSLEGLDAGAGEVITASEVGG